ncbi:hypothetical protein Tco_0273389, partial [Tanacetum coccineum]
PKKKDTQIPQSSVPSDNVAEEAINEENVHIHSNDLLLSGEDRLKLKELMTLCANLQNRVLDLEHTKTTQALEIDSLKRRVKKLEKKKRSRTHGLKRLYKVGLSARVISFEDEDKDITLDSTHFDTDPDIFGMHDLDGDEVFIETKEHVVNAATTASTIPVSVAKDLSDVDMTLAQALAELKNVKLKAVKTGGITTTTAVIRPKAKGLVIHEQEQTSTPITSSKKQKVNDDNLIAKLQSMMEVIPDEKEVSVDAIPLATKPPSIVDWNIIKEGKIGYYQIIRADGNSKRYSSMIQMLKGFDREDLETLWKLVKAKHGYTRPEEGYERVL